MQARERLFITADKKRLVKEGDPKGAFLYAAPGDEIPESAATMFGLVDGALAEEKRRDKGDDKSRKDGNDKDRTDGGDKDKPQSDAGGGGASDASTARPTDLTEIKGIGAASAKALAAAGIASFEALAAVDPESPPAVEGLGARVAWADWVKAAAEKLPPAEPTGGGLTITELPSEE